MSNRWRWGHIGGRARYNLERDGDKFDLHFVERHTGRRRRVARYSTFQAALAGIPRDWAKVEKDANYGFTPAA